MVLYIIYLNLGCKIEMTINILDKETKIIAQTYHAYESKKNYNNYPILSDNSDPDYRE